MWCPCSFLMDTFSLDHNKSADKLKKMGIPVFEPYKSENQVFKKDGWYLKAFPLSHNGTENRGVFVMTPSGESLVYATDFGYIAHKFVKLGINHFLIECNHMDDISKEDNEGKFAHVLRGHSSLSTCMEFLKVNKTEKLKSVGICHLSSDNAQPDVMLAEVQKVVGDNVICYIAKKGVSINLDEQSRKKEEWRKNATTKDEAYD